MTERGLEVFDKTLQTTNTWLAEIGETLGPDRQRCYHALRAVLFALRDRLTADEAAHLAAQLPMLVRGIFYDGYRPSGKPEKIKSREQFLARIQDHLGQIRPLGSEEAALAVFRVLQRHVAQGEMQEVVQSLPEDIRTLFSTAGSGSKTTTGSGQASRRRAAAARNPQRSAVLRDDEGEAKHHGDKLARSVRRAAERSNRDEEA